MDLNSPISDLPKVGPILSGKLNKLGISTLGNLLYHVPTRYMDYSQVVTINRVRPGEIVTIHAKIVSLKNIFSKRGLKMQIGAVEDATGKLSVIWFNQPYLVKMLYPGKSVSLSGKLGFFNHKLVLSSPDYEILEEDDRETLHTGRLVPVYPETAGLSSKWLRTLILKAEDAVDKTDFLPTEILKKYKLEDFTEAIHHVHFPENLKEAEKGRERLAFDEVLKLQLRSLHRKMNWEKYKVSHKLKIDKSIIQKFVDSLPFKLTESQNKAINEILGDLEKPVPMNRLLEGDVGSGKTLVAASGAFATFANGYQTVLMAPTQILATQHYETLKKIFAPFNVRVSLITSSVKKIEIGRSDIFVGTHSLIHKKIKFGIADHASRVAYVVIDEQHRFGVEQRQHLVKKTGVPHVLTMTATPIPRTIALTTYGDLDLSVLTEMPGGRQKITTWVVPNSKRDSSYNWMKKQIKEEKSQIFIVCPLIEDSETETLADVKSVTSEFTKLSTIFKGFKLGLLHGRMKPEEKTKVLNSFRKGETDMLVTTPVVEVGIDIPNATVMVIEAAERFGLAGLHQLRGRVGRGKKKSYCLLFSNFSSGNAYARLKAMERSESGFELAELDLKMRGPGEIFGTAQSGFPELKIASWNNYELIKNTKELAEDVIKSPQKYPKLNLYLESHLQVA